MEKKDNVEKGVSGKPEKKKSAAYYEKRPEFGNRGPSKILLHFRKGITFFLVIAACVIFYFLLLRIEDISVDRELDDNSDESDCHSHLSTL